jgi:hypothetical protein
MTWGRRLLVLVALAAVAGCATAYEPSPRQSQPPRARCLADPTDTTMRPLLFLFCVETP